MRSFIAIAGLVAIVAASAPAPAKTVTVTEDVTVTSCEAVVTDCGDWEDVPSDETTTVVTATWEDAADPEPTVSGTWADVPVASTLVSSWVDAPAPTPVSPAEGTSTWVDVPVPVAPTASKPVASYEPNKPVSPDTYTGAASKMAGAGLAGVAALAALLL